MLLTWSDQTDELPRYLEQFRLLPVMPYDAARMRRRVVVCPLPGHVDLARMDRFWAFDIFPPRFLKAATEWRQHGRAMRVGDTIAQQITLPGLARVAPKIVAGVRICDVLRTPKRIAFSYETLQGHAEQGASQFAVEAHDDGTKTFSITTWSRPSMLAARLTAPVFANPLMGYCTRAALLHFAAGCCEASAQ